MPNVAARLYPWLPVRWLSRFRYDTLQALEVIDCPTLIIHSRDDDIIPYAEGEQLYARARAPKRFLELHGSHSDGFLVSGQIYIRGIDRFLQSHLLRPRSDSRPQQEARPRGGFSQTRG